MKTRTCFLFVFEGYADWEPALAIAGLQSFTDVEIKTVSHDGKPVHSMGNICVVPDHSLIDGDFQNSNLLILPGGDPWDEGKNREVLPLVKDFLDHNQPLAAICGATSFLGQHGFIDERPHTSNHLEYYLKVKAPSYRGDRFYRKEPCVVDGNLITANGTATVAFAEAIFKKLGVLENEKLQSWFQFFQRPEAALQ